MIIAEESKFNIGDQVYVVESYEDFDKPESCDVCNGTGDIEVVHRKDNNMEFQKFTCPFCDGDGVIHSNETTKQFKLMYDTPATVDSISLHIDKSNTPIRYGLIHGPYNKKENRGFHSFTEYEQNCFLDLNKALEEVKKRSAEPYNEEWRYL